MHYSQCSCFYACIQATKCLELKIEKIKDTYTSGILSMKELATALQKKAFSDLEEMKLSISAQMMAVENVWFERREYVIS